MRYVAARARTESALRAYRFYIADNVRVIGQNTANFVGEHGAYYPTRFEELLNPAEEPEEDTRSCVEIVHDMWKVIRREADGEPIRSGSEADA